MIRPIIPDEIAKSLDSVVDKINDYTRFNIQIPNELSNISEEIVKIKNFSSIDVDIILERISQSHIEKVADSQNMLISQLFILYRKLIDLTSKDQNHREKLMEYILKLEVKTKSYDDIIPVKIFTIFLKFYSQLRNEAFQRMKELCENVLESVEKTHEYYKVNEISEIDLELLSPNETIN